MAKHADLLKRHKAVLPAWIALYYEHPISLVDGDGRRVVDAEGNEYAFKGVYHDIVAPERVVQTFEFEGVPGHVSLDTATLEEIDGKTKFVAVSVFQSIEDRDGMVQSGMEGGARETYDRLAEVIAGLLVRA